MYSIQEVRRYHELAKSKKVAERLEAATKTTSSEDLRILAVDTDVSVLDAVMENHWCNTNERKLAYASLRALYAEAKEDLERIEDLKELAARYG